MIIGGILILISLILYNSYYPKNPPKGSLTYYKQKWKTISELY